MGARYWLKYSIGASHGQVQPLTFKHSRSGGYVGAAQIIGAKQNVDKCKAVVQIEVNAVVQSNIRAKVLIPVGSKTTSKIKRIYGVGVSAIIDIRI